MNTIKKSLIIAGAMMTALAANAQNADWLTRLPDNVAVRELSVPGAHDAATGNGFKSSLGAAFSGVTQSLTLSAQWDAGVRAFDLRPAYKAGVDGNLQIYHGILETKTSMKAALQTLVDKLAASGGEMAIVVMRHENESDDNSELWAPAMSELLTEFDPHIVAFSPGLTLGQARGKILILTRDQFTSAKAGVITGVSHSENFDDQKKGLISLGRNKAVLYQQDFYECQTAERKYQAFITLLDYSTTHSNSIWVINNTSGYTGSMGTNSAILNLAKSMNPQVAAYLGQAAPGRTGIVMMDFAGTATYSGSAIGGKDLVDKIIAQNNKYIDTEVASIASVDPDDDPDDDSIYDLCGRYVGRGADSLGCLPAGVYIYCRRKVVVR